MSITTWEETVNWVASIGPEGSNLGQEFILSMPNNIRDKWRKSVSRFGPNCEYRGSQHVISKEKRGGQILSTMVAGKPLQLLVSREKSPLIHSMLRCAEANLTVCIGFKPYIHFEYGFIGMVHSVQESQPQKHSSIYVLPKKMPASSLNPIEINVREPSRNHSPITTLSSCKQWSTKEDNELVSLLNQDVGLREIAFRLGFGTKTVLDAMLKNNIINDTQFLAIKNQLIAIGCYN